MKLYFSPMSPNCRKVTALISFIGAKVDLEPVDLAGGENEKPRFLKLNPNGLVPVLEDGKFSLWESNAIMQYLAEKTGAKEVWPVDIQARADITRWQMWEASHWSKAVGGITFEKVFKPMMGGMTDHARLEEALEQFHTLAEVLNGHMEGHKFICGDKPTLADFSIAGMATYCKAAEMPMDEYRHINEWWQRIEKLEAWKKTEPPRH